MHTFILYDIIVRTGIEIHLITSSCNSYIPNYYLQITNYIFKLFYY